ncbi:MAG: ribonuclease P protein component [Actinomycetota bacterium]|nr:ribonuclease P protein component [Actinomycetota bacterium]MDQ3679963.1 ribonuclease P protein component [Actinomycetota bacterium]
MGPVADRATFAALRRSDRRVRRGPITITYAAGHPTEQVRVAYAVGRRVGGAVRRNRLRRQLRAVMSDHGARLRPGAYLVGAGAGATALSFAELRERVTEALNREKLLKSPDEELDS